MLRLKTSLLVKSKIRFYQRKNWAIFYIFTHASVPWARAVELATWYPRLDPWFLYFKKPNWKVVRNKNLVAKMLPWYFWSTFEMLGSPADSSWWSAMFTNSITGGVPHVARWTTPKDHFLHPFMGHAWPCCNSQIVSANNEYYGPCDSAQLAIAVLVHLWCIPHSRFVAGPRSFRGIAWPASRIC